MKIIRFIVKTRQTKYRGKCCKRRFPSRLSQEKIIMNYEKLFVSIPNNL